MVSQGCCKSKSLQEENGCVMDQEESIFGEANSSMKHSRLLSTTAGSNERIE